jgi:elongation factor Ts
MTISAKQVKELRDSTGAGMMDCKKALEENAGDLEAAREWLQKKGIASAQKRSGRAASEGVVAAFHTADRKAALLLEVNCETDFVARNDEFRAFVDGLGKLALAKEATSANQLLELELDGTPVSERVLQQSGKTGENFVVRRLAWVRVPAGAHGHVGSYIHDGKIGVLVAATAATHDAAKNDALAEIARDVAMHVAAMDPVVVSSDALDPAVVSKQQEIFAAQAAESGKPADIVSKMVLGRVSKWKKEVSLLDQPFVKDNELTVGQYVAKHGQERTGEKVAITAFARFALGGAVEE